MQVLQLPMLSVRLQASAVWLPVALLEQMYVSPRFVQKTAMPTRDPTAVPTPPPTQTPTEVLYARTRTRTCACTHMCVHVHILHALNLLKAFNMCQSCGLHGLLYYREQRFKMAARLFAYWNQ